MWIPENLIRHRILGRNRIDPCYCGHYHMGKEIPLPTFNGIQFMDMLVAMSDYKSPSEMDAALEHSMREMVKTCLN